MKAICMNLPHRTDRFEQAKKEFKDFGIRVEFFKAYPNKDGRIGLQQTLLEIFTWADEHSLDRILIFEDDVKFIGPVSRFNAALNDLKGVNFDMLYLGATLLDGCVKVTENLALIHRALACHAVVYHRRMFKDYLKHLNRVVQQGYIAKHEDISDVFLAQEIQEREQTYMVWPIVATQRPSFSDIEKTFVDYSFIERICLNIKH